jgi:hypothetical protein
MLPPEAEDKTGPAPRKSIWPWLLLLIVVLLVIYGYDRATELFAEFERNMPQAIIDLLNAILNDVGIRPGAPDGIPI